MAPYPVGARSNSVAKRKIRPGHYYGLRAIAKVLGCSQFGVRSKIVKMHFPAFKVSGANACGGMFYEWYTNDDLIKQWSQTQIERSWREIAASATGKRFAYTREANHAPVEPKTSTDEPV